MEQRLTVKKITDASKVLAETIKISEMIGLCREAAIQYGIEQVLNVVGVDIRAMFELENIEVNIENKNWLMIIETLKKTPGMTALELAVYTGENHNTIKTWLKRMRSKRILRSVKGKHYIWHEVNENVDDRPYDQAEAES